MGTIQFCRIALSTVDGYCIDALTPGTTIRRVSSSVSVVVSQVKMEWPCRTIRQQVIDGSPVDQS